MHEMQEGARAPSAPPQVAPLIIERICILQEMCSEKRFSELTVVLDGRTKKYVVVASRQIIF